MSDTLVLKKVEAWFETETEAHDHTAFAQLDETPDLLGASSEDTSERLLAHADVVMSENDLMVSSLFEEDPDVEKKAQLFIQSPIHALKLIMSIAQKKSGYDPIMNQNESIANKRKLKAYANMLAGFPLVHIASAYDNTVKYEEKNYNSLIEAVMGLFDGIISK